MHTKTRPEVSFDSTATPSRKSSPRPASTTRMSGACGWVSVAVTKIDRGAMAGLAMRPNGRVRSAVHRPDSSSSARTSSVPSAATGRPENDAKGTASSPALRSTATTSATKARRTPRCTASTVPVAGAV